MIKVNQDILKIIALIAMTVDHLARVSGYMVLGPFVLFGRLAFPIFGFLIMYHLWQKRCYVKYLQRLTIFGIFSQIIFMPFGYSSNILISFLWPVLTLYLFDKIQHSHLKNIARYLLNTLIVFIGIFISSFFDYNEFGYLYLLLMYAFLKYRTLPIGVLLAISALSINGFNIYESLIGFVTTFGLFMIPIVGGKRLISWKYALYIYYPLHLVILLSLKYFGLFG